MGVPTWHLRVAGKRCNKQILSDASFSFLVPCLLFPYHACAVHISIMRRIAAADAASGAVPMSTSEMSASS